MGYSINRPLFYEWELYDRQLAFRVECILRAGLKVPPELKKLYETSVRRLEKCETKGV